MVLTMASFKADFLKTHYDLLMVKCLDMMKASKWYLLMVIYLVIYLEVQM